MEAFIIIGFIIFILFAVAAILDFITYIQSLPKQSGKINLRANELNKTTETSNRNTFDNEGIHEKTLLNGAPKNLYSTDIGSMPHNNPLPNINLNAKNSPIENTELITSESTLDINVNYYKQVPFSKVNTNYSVDIQQKNNLITNILKSLSNSKLNGISNTCIQNELSNECLKTDIKYCTSSILIEDNSIIDITPISEINIEAENNITNELKVPFWPHQYIYSHSEIFNASSEQQIFYAFYKNSFLKGEYLDLKGNTNYAFILLFDLFDSFDKYPKISEFENHIKALGQNYPKTKSYGVSFLIKKMESLGAVEEALRLNHEYDNQFNEYEWRLGVKYKTKLNLQKEEVELLNGLYFPSNNFCSIEYCCLEVLKLYILTIAELNAKYLKEEKTSLVNHFNSVATIIAQNHLNHREGNYYQFSIYSIIKEFHSIIFKYCENAVRDHYGHKRKLNTESYFTDSDDKREFETKIIKKLDDALIILKHKISPINTETEIELNSQNTLRWKIKFKELTENYNENGLLFLNDIIRLGELNIKNPSVENIFFEASKFISKNNKEVALKLYLYYLYYDLKSSVFDNKQLPKTILQKLFKTNEQFLQFELVVSEFIKDKKLDKALDGISCIYEVRRKKIKIDTTLINEVHEKHSETVEILNEYLKDEDEDSVIKETGRDVDVNEIIQKNEFSNNSIYLREIPFTPIHISILETFLKNDFSVPQSELDNFAKSKGLFKNQIIDNINEICYEILDDILIEDDEDNNTMNPQYYQRILAL